MTTPRLFARLALSTPLLRPLSAAPLRSFAARRLSPLARSPPVRRYATNPADEPGFQSILDQPPVLVRAGQRRHGWGLLIIIAIPATAFALGTWQVKRLEWKTELLAQLEDRILRPPLPLPASIDTEAVSSFDYRRIVATGTFRHDQEMLVGPRMRDGENGYLVITPLERPNGTKILVNRGWIAKSKRDHASRGEGALPTDEVTVEGLLRSPWKKNMFTPDNRPEIGEFYFPDVVQMAGLVGAQPVWVEATMEPDLIQEMNATEIGKPIGRPAEVNVRNNHMQYIITWYGLAFATSVMLYILLKKPTGSITRRVRQSKDWQ